MKKAVLLSSCILAVILSLFACQNQNKTDKPAAKGKSAFPPALAGTWKSEDSRFTIVLSPQGTLSSAVVPLLGAEIRPNKTTKIEMKDGSFSTFTAGDCPVDYDPVTRELSVIIYVEKLRIKFMEIENKGCTKDIFAGKVSEDGKSWLPDWISLFDYGRDLPQDPNDAYLGPLPFEKVSE